MLYEPYDTLTAEIEKLQSGIEAFLQNHDTKNNNLLEASSRRLSERLGKLRDQLGLSPIEVDIVLLCAGVELRPELAQLCSEFHGDPNLAHVSPHLIMSLFGRMGAKALDRKAPIRDWHVIRVGPGHLSLSVVRLDRAILHFLMGNSYQDQLFAGRLQSVRPLSISPIPASYQEVAAVVDRFWQRSYASSAPIQLCNQDIETQQQLAALLLPKMDLQQISALTLPFTATELHEFCQCWQRQFHLQEEVLLIDCHALKDNDAERLAAVNYLLETLKGPIVVLSLERLSFPSLPFTIDVPHLTTGEQKALWSAQLEDDLPKSDWSHTFGNLVAQFNLSVSGIALVSERALAGLTDDQLEDADEITSALWDSCRSQSRTQLEGFAKRIEPNVGWDDLVLPEETVEKIQQIIDQVRSRSTVYEQWNLAGTSGRGTGITAMFYGLSGTGKTTAAELIAQELNLDLYRIDLSAIVSKYIGETEKNLSKIFAAAESAGAILQFDEADAIVGKRSAVKDARDRYANMEVSYLLQRMEAYPGLAILTTNLPDSLDSAFLRRLRFSIEFTAPQYWQRLQIWKKVYNESVPIEEIDWRYLADVYMTGATIRNVAMGAAFLAAGEGKKINMGHLYLSADAEFLKMKMTKPVNLNDWEPDEMKEARKEKEAARQKRDRRR